MNPNDNAVDRILEGLRDVQPPAGMNRRILNTLEAAAEITPRRAKVRWTLRTWTGALRPAALLRWTPAAALAVLAIAIIASRGTHHDDVAKPAIAAQESAPSSRRDTATPALPIAASLPKITGHSHRNAEPVMAALQETSAPPQADKEAANISHPAPPIPITAEERLLLRYALHGRQQDLAQISNDRRAKEEAQQKEAFQAFFQPPPTTNPGESE